MVCDHSGDATFIPELSVDGFETYMCDTCGALMDLDSGKRLSPKDLRNLVRLVRLTEIKKVGDILAKAIKETAISPDQWVEFKK